jgi:hypothetical protein
MTNTFPIKYKFIKISRLPEFHKNNFPENHHNLQFSTSTAQASEMNMTQNKVY